MIGWYMEKLMRKMGFAEAWVKLMMMSISSATYSVFINGNPKGTLPKLEALDKAIPSPLIYFYCVRRVFMGY